ncbi:unnamed protein product [Caenorhabditis nigoni]
MPRVVTRNKNKKQRRISQFEAIFGENPLDKFPTTIVCGSSSKHRKVGEEYLEVSTVIRLSVSMCKMTSCLTCLLIFTLLLGLPTADANGSSSTTATDAPTQAPTVARL